MALIKVINGSAEQFSFKTDLIFTDPPFDMNGIKINEIVSKYDCDHLVLISTMRQILEFNSLQNWDFCFDIILDAVIPKKSKSRHQPNYVHANVIYYKRNGVKSKFNRELRQRSDTFDNNGYWPSIVRAPRERLNEHGLAKNYTAILDILGSFENVNNVTDCFAGSGTTGLAALELSTECTLVEIDKPLSEKLETKFKFLGELIE